MGEWSEEGPYLPADAKASAMAGGEHGPWIETPRVKALPLCRAGRLDNRMVRLRSPQVTAQLHNCTTAQLHNCTTA